MDASALAEMMLKWERLQAMADEVAEAIKDAVLQMGKTQTVGNVRATYSGGRRSFDYQGPGAAADPEIIAAHTETVTTTDWRAVCMAAKIEPPVVSQSPPSVSLKVLK